MKSEKLHKLTDKQIAYYQWVLGIGGVFFIAMGFMMPEHLFDPFLARVLYGGSWIVVAVSVAFSNWVRNRIVPISHVLFHTFLPWITFLLYKNNYDLVFWPGFFSSIIISPLVFTERSSFTWALLHFGLYSTLIGIHEMLWANTGHALVIAPFAYLSMFLCYIAVSKRELLDHRLGSLSSFGEYNPSPVFEIGEKGNIVYANTAGVEMLEDLGEDIASDVLNRLANQLRIIGEQIGHEQIRIKHRVFESHYYIFPARNSVRFFLADITQRWHTEKELERTNQIFKILLESLNEGILWVDNDDKVVYVNQQFTKMSGYTLHELEGRVAMDVFLSNPGDEEQREEIERRLEARKQNKTEAYEWTLRKKSGIVMETLVSAAPLVINKDVIGSIGIISDITSLKDTQRKLANKTKEMETFLNYATHILRGPIASGQGIIQVAMGHAQNNPLMHNFLSYAGTSLRRLDMAVRDLIRYSQINQHGFELHDVKLPWLLEEVLTELRAEMEVDDIEVLQQVAVNDSFHSDRYHLYSLLYSLLKNAFMYRREGNYLPVVEVSMVSYEQGILIRVKDNGEGIKKDIQKHVFEMFYRGNYRSKGTGLGLYIVQQCVNKMNGWLKLHSEVKKGTLVEVYLPELEKDTFPESREVEFLHHS